MPWGSCPSPGMIVQAQGSFTGADAMCFSSPVLEASVALLNLSTRVLEW